MEHIGGPHLRLRGRPQRWSRKFATEHGGRPSRERSGVHPILGPPLAPTLPHAGTEDLM